ncbi:ALIX V-shaped domain binding to HIV-domain-containing protein [Infundibulicybe gibba]|nr:ALIX V-shaped domain binding to HIV-domain-containing protein [Infundibulicybe gibba]
MPNLLAIPFKKTDPIDVKEATRNYLYNRGGVHPDEFKDDILRWQSLRKDAVGEIVHTDRIRTLLIYHAQLVSVLAKLPADVGHTIYLCFSSSRILLNNLVFERASVLFNLAALFSRLAALEDRSTRDGIKRAKNNYEQAAGTLSYLFTSVLPTLTYSPNDEVPLDLSPALVEALEWLMLAQAQECAWQAAKLGTPRRPKLQTRPTHRIASKASSLYRTVSATLQDAIPNIKHILPSEWILHIQAKEHHFQAVAQYRKSMDDIEASMDLRLLDLNGLESRPSKGKRSLNGTALRPSPPGSSLAFGCGGVDLTRARRDNDLIYHHDVPTLSSLPSIPDAALATPTIPPGLTNPSTILGSRPVLFEELLGWGAREAIHIYNDRKNNLVNDRIIDGARELKDNADEVLRSLNLPSALEALERPIGLPPSLLRKAEEVRLENGPAKIEASIEDVQRLAHHDLAILDEANTSSRLRASEDEAARKDIPINRPPSHQANAELVEKEKRYRNVLEQAASSDEIVRQKWDEWERNIVELTWSEACAELEASVPSTAIKSTAQLTAEGMQTQSHARALRVLLESLDALRQARERVVTRAQTLSHSDDISARILKVSSGFERLAEVQPAMFEDVMDEELANKKQTDVLLEVKSRNELFLQSRRDDPSLKEREHALQSLDLAYLKYREITRNLEEGFKFYNDLAGILIQFKEGCKNWSHHRHQEIHSLSRSLKAMTLGEDSESPRAKKTNANSRAPTSTSPRSKPPTGKSALGLPAITSSDWEFEEVPLPPGPPDRK